MPRAATRSALFAALSPTECGRLAGELKLVARVFGQSARTTSEPNHNPGDACDAPSNAPDARLAPALTNLRAIANDLEARAKDAPEIARYVDVAEAARLCRLSPRAFKKYADNIGLQGGQALGSKTLIYRLDDVLRAVEAWMPAAYRAPGGDVVAMNIRTAYVRA